MTENFMQGLTEPGGILNTLTSNKSLSTAEQLGLYLTLHHFEGGESFYKAVVGLRLVNQALEGVHSASTHLTEKRRNEAILAIAQYVKLNPRCREEELQAEICRQIQTFAQSLQ